MSVKIGHASLDEHGNIAGGTAGDQNKKEVCTRSWYDYNWDYVLRCSDSKIAEKMAKACEAGCANNKIGYDQHQRNTLYTKAKAVGMDLSKITSSCECDCSSFMCVCAIAAGLSDSFFYINGNIRTTSSMKSAFVKTGKFQVLTANKYTEDDSYLQRGDILVRAGYHTVMVLSNGDKVVVSAPSASENKTFAGKGIGTATAKQTIAIRAGSSTKYKLYGYAKKGTKVEILEILSNGWMKIVWPEASVGYAYTSNVNGTYYTVSLPVVYKAAVTAYSLNVRSGPSTGYKIIKTIHKDDVVTIIEEKNNWGRLSDKSGWVSLKYMKRVA